MSEERLQKVLARSGIASRRQIEEMIREGRITINGRAAELGDKADLERDAVKVDGRRIGPPDPQRRYVLVYMPEGYVSTTHDPEGRPSVLDILPHSMRHNMKPVGRLDYHSEGLLILTDDGDFAHRVAHPRFGCGKTYEVKIKGQPDERAVEKLRHGIVIDGRRTTPAEVAPLEGRLGPRKSVDNSWWRVVLFEGRNRQIREMFFRVGHPVIRLRRVAIGPVADGLLGPGVWRELTEREVFLLQRPPKKKKKTRPKPHDGEDAKERPMPEGGRARKGPPKARPAKGRGAKSRPAKGRGAKSWGTKSQGPKGPRTRGRRK